jgi:hypothetical protein
MQKAALADPALFLDQVAVHDRDLAGGAAKAVQRHLDPKPERLFEGNLFDPNIAAVLHANLKRFDKDKAVRAVVQIDFSLDSIGGR